MRQKKVCLFSIKEKPANKRKMRSAGVTQTTPKHIFKVYLDLNMIYWSYPPPSSSRFFQEFVTSVGGWVCLLKPDTQLWQQMQCRSCHDAVVCRGAELTQSTAQQSLQPRQAGKQSCKNNQFTFCPCVQMEVDPVGYIAAPRIANV